VTQLIGIVKKNRKTLSEGFRSEAEGARSLQGKGCGERDGSPLPRLNKAEPPAGGLGAPVYWFTSGFYASSRRATQSGGRGAPEASGQPILKVGPYGPTMAGWHTATTERKMSSDWCGRTRAAR